MTERRRSSATRAKVSRSGPPVCRSGLSLCLLLVFFLVRGRGIADVFWEVFFSLFFDCAGFPVSALGAGCWSLCIFSLYLYGAGERVSLLALVFFSLFWPKESTGSLEESGLPVYLSIVDRFSRYIDTLLEVRWFCVSSSCSKSAFLVGTQVFP